MEIADSLVEQLNAKIGEIWWFTFLELSFHFFNVTWSLVSKSKEVEASTSSSNTSTVFRDKKGILLINFMEWLLACTVEPWKI